MLSLCEVVSLKDKLPLTGTYLGEKPSAWIRELINPFVEEDTPGRAYFPDKTSIGFYRKNGSNEWQLTFFDKKRQEIASGIYFPKIKKASLIKCTNQEGFLDVLNQVRFQEPIIMLNRLASPDEIQELQELCAQSLQDRRRAVFVSDQDFPFDFSGPVIRCLDISQLAKNDYLLCLREKTLLPKEPPTPDKEMTISLNPRPKALRENWIEELPHPDFLVISRIMASDLTQELHQAFTRLPQHLLRIVLEIAPLTFSL